MINPIKNRKVEVEFTTHGYSPLLGRIWPTRKATLNYSTARRFVDEGQAVFTDEKEQAKVPVAETSAPAEESVTETETEPETVDSESEKEDDVKEDKPATKKKAKKSRKKSKK